MHKLIDKYEFLNILREDNTTNIKEPYFSDKLYVEHDGKKPII